MIVGGSPAGRTLGAGQGLIGAVRAARQVPGFAVPISTSILASFTALAAQGSVMASIPADPGFVPVFTPNNTSDGEVVAVAGSGPSAQLVIGKVAGWPHSIAGTMNLGSVTVPTTITIAPAPTITAPLPGLPLPVGAKVVGHGDSYTGFNNIGNVGAVAAAPSTEKGLIEAAWQADPRFNFDSWSVPNDPWSRDAASGGLGVSGANQGIPGDHLAIGGNSSIRGGGITSRVAYTIARGPAIVVLNSLGINTIASSDSGGYRQDTPASYLTGKIDAMISQFTNAGIYVVLSTLYPVGRGGGITSFAEAGGRHQTIRDVNTWIRAQAGRAGVLGIVDPYNSLVSGTDPDDVNPAYYLEGASGIHLNAAGIALVRPLLSAILNNAITAGSVFDQNPANNNLDTSPSMNGSTGAKTGTSSTGVVATGYALYMSRQGGGSTQAASKDNAGNPVQNKQIVTITPGATGAWDQSRLTFPAITTGLPAAGQWIRAYVFVETAAGQPAANMVLQVNVLDTAGNTVVTALAGVIDSNQYTSAALGVNVPSGRGGYWLATKPFQIPAGVTVGSITRLLYANFWTGGYAAGSTIVYKASVPIVRIAADPRPAWNLAA